LNLLSLCEKILSLKTPTKTKLCSKYTFNKKRSEESSRNVCSADLEDNLGKEERHLSNKLLTNKFA
jgi:hypothetical protein